MPNKNDTAEIQVNEIEHLDNHSKKVNKLQKGEEILKRCNISNMLPEDIQVFLKANDIKLELEQIRNMKVRMKKKEIGEAIFTFEKMRFWCEENIVLPTTSFPDKAYVAAFEINEELKEFRILITTRRLMNLATKTIMTQVDATYKTNAQRFPLIIVGFCDAMHSFHPSIIAITSSETSKDYTFVLQEYKRQIMVINELEYFEPSFLMGDGAEAITLAKDEVFPQARRTMCWTHALKRMKNQLSQIKDNEVSKKILTDIYFLQSLPNFHVEWCNLFISKWTNIDNTSVNSFLKYFSDQWIKQQPN
jgi:hypothetical protein